MDSSKDYDKKTYLSFEFSDKEIDAFYSTDVITHDTNKSLTIETEETIYNVVFSSDNGESDTFIKKTKSF